MNIDEMIEKEKEYAEKAFELSKVRKTALAAYEYHMQLIKMLEELEMLREEKKEFQIIAKDNYEIGYNKAIDEFVENINLPITTESQISEIEEQLKKEN